VGAFEAALAAMREAGVVLVPMDMSLLVDMGVKELPDKLFYTFEYPRELSRYCALLNSAEFHYGAGGAGHARMQIQ
jgi:hypothetical protein